MGLKFRRGTTAQKSGSLAFGEPYVNTDLGTLQIGGATGDITLGASGTGSQGSFAGISGSSLDITGNAKIDGNLTLGGAITIGDATADTVNVIASLSSSLIPQTTNAFDLGSASKIWRDLYISTGSIKFIGAGGSVVSTLSINANGSQNFPNDLVVNGLTLGKGLNSIISNTAVGISALSTNTSGTSNVAVGSNALKVNTTGGSNTAIGAEALQANTTTNANTAVGWGALRYNTGANGNTAVGSGALQMNTTGNGNTAVGNATLSANTTGVNNTALGTNVLSDNAGNNNIGVGTNALRLNASGSYNIAIGYSALQWHTTGQGNIAIGDEAGDLITTGSYNTIIGKYTGTGSLSNNIVLADGQGNIKYRWDGTNNNLYGNVTTSGSIIPGATNTYDLGSATNIWKDLYISTGSIKIVANGSVVSTLSTNADGSQTFPNGLYSQANIQIGDGSYLDAGKFQVGRRGTSPDQNVVLGIDIMPSLTSGVGNVGLGRTSLYRLTTGNSNIGIGSGAGYGISGSNNNNIAIGYGTAFFMTGSNVDQNVFLGTNAATNLNDGIYNTAIGGNALLGSANSNDTPTKSTALGYSAGAYLIGNSTNNLLLGANAGPSSNTEESYKFYVSNGDTGEQSFMLGNMANGSRTLSINAATTISGSVTGTSFNGTINATNGIVSGSSQITYASISSIPGGIVSGSSQITYASISSIPSGIVSGSSQVSLGSASGNIALATQTTGDYVASLVASTGVTITNNSGENATPSIAIGQAVATSSNVQFNSLGVGMAASATAGRIDATNDIVAFSSSDIRFKENITPIENALDKISKISGNTYDWKAENKIEHGYEGNDVGVIAQEIEAVLPQLVQTRENGFKAVKYDKLVALLIQGIKEQQLQIEELKAKIGL